MTLCTKIASWAHCAVAAADPLLENEMDIAIAGFMAFTGHLYSVFLKFKGGKGVATGLGIFIYMMPVAALSSAGIFALTMGVTGYVAISSMLGAISLPLFGLLYQMPTEYVYSSVIVALLIVLKHKGNIQRLLGGTEPKFGEK